MDPLTLSALIGGIGTTVGGLMGASAQSEANEQNWKINLLNYYQRQKEHDDAVRMAGEVRADQKLGGTDARGNRTHFVPGKGWVTELSGTGQAMQDAQDKEQFRVLNQDLPAQREHMFDNLRRQKGEDFIAEGILDKMKRPQELSSDTRARYATAAAQGANGQYDMLTNALMKSALRTGSSNIPQILQGIAGPRAQAVGGAMAQASMAGDQAHDSAASSNMGKLANLYNLFASRASANPKVSYKPQNVDTQADAQMGKFASIANTGDAAAINAAGRQGGTIDYVQPDYGWGNAVSTGAQAFAGGLNNIYTAKRFSGNNSSDNRDF